MRLQMPDPVPSTPQPPMEPGPSGTPPMEVPPSPDPHTPGRPAAAASPALILALRPA